jgi:hypothetical protein
MRTLKSFIFRTDFSHGGTPKNCTVARQPHLGRTHTATPIGFRILRRPVDQHIYITMCIPSQRTYSTTLTLYNNTCYAILNTHHRRPRMLPGSQPLKHRCMAPTRQPPTPRRRAKSPRPLAQRAPVLRDARRYVGRELLRTGYHVHDFLLPRSCEDGGDKSQRRHGVSRCLGDDQSAKGAGGCG